MVSAGGFLAEGPRLGLRRLRRADVSSAYVGWLNDADVTRFLESRFSPHSEESTAAYVSKLEGDPNNVLLGIFLLDGARHIGNIKVGPIDRHHLCASVGIVIGDKGCWGKGFATEAISLATRYAFASLGLHRLEAGAYAENVGSAKAFVKAGWHEEGRERSKWLCEGRFVDGLRVACVNGSPSEAG